LIYQKRKKLKNMFKIEIAKKDYTAATNNLEQLGYTFDGVEIDRRGKKHTMFSKDGMTLSLKVLISLTLK